MYAKKDSIVTKSQMSIGSLIQKQDILKQKMKDFKQQKVNITRPRNTRIISTDKEWMTSRDN